MKTKFWPFFSILCFFIFGHNAFAGYDKKIAGFYLNHFAQMKDLKDPSCKPFLNELYRGGQPIFDGSNNWIDTIKSNKIKIVFDLREETKNAALERDTLLANGIGYVKLPLRTSGSSQLTNLVVEVATPAIDQNSSPVITKTSMPNAAATIYVLNLMEKSLSEQSDNAIYLHCQRGEDRTGLIVALLRDCSGNAWKSEFNEYGGVMYKPLQKLMTDVNKLRN